MTVVGSRPVMQSDPIELILDGRTLKDWVLQREGVLEVDQVADISTEWSDKTGGA
jgi:hypothetical protein